MTQHSATISWGQIKHHQAEELPSIKTYQFGKCILDLHIMLYEKKQNLHFLPHVLLVRDLLL